MRVNLKISKSNHGVLFGRHDRCSSFLFLVLLIVSSSAVKVKKLWSANDRKECKDVGAPMTREYFNVPNFNACKALVKEPDDYFLSWYEKDKKCTISKECSEITRINEGPDTYVVSSNDECAAFDFFGERKLYSQIEVDFQFNFGKQPLTKEEFEAAREYCNIDLKGSECFVIKFDKWNTPHVVQNMESFQSRHAITFQLIQRVLDKYGEDMGDLEGLELIIDTGDGYLGDPCSPDIDDGIVREGTRNCRERGGAIFMMAKSPSQGLGILYPDFSFYSWPEAECSNIHEDDEENGPKSKNMNGLLYDTVFNELLNDEELQDFNNKTDVLFWRGASTSLHRDAALRNIEGSLPEHLRDVKVMTWAKNEQTLSHDNMLNKNLGGQGNSPECKNMRDWCTNKLLANIPGATMALSLKYRLLCNSVMVTPPFVFVQWFYRLLNPEKHFLHVHLNWDRVDDVVAGVFQALNEVGEERDSIVRIADDARFFAKTMLSPMAVDCYWRRLIEKASYFFPKFKSQDRPTLHLPMQIAIWNSRLLERYAFQVEKSVETVVVLHACASHVREMVWFKRAWLDEAFASNGGKLMYYFLVSKEDPNVEYLFHNNYGSDLRKNTLLLDAQHGYPFLIQKLVKGFEEVFKRHPNVKRFYKGDLDTYLPFHHIQNLIPAVESATDMEIFEQTMCDLNSQVVDNNFHLRQGDYNSTFPACVSTCAMHPNCQWFQWLEPSWNVTNGMAQCLILKHCANIMPLPDEVTRNSGRVYLVRYRMHAEDPTAEPMLMPQYANVQQHQESMRENRRNGLSNLVFPQSELDFPIEQKAEIPYIFGTVLVKSAVFCHRFQRDMMAIPEKHWNNCQYVNDMHMMTYAPYVEGTGYVMHHQVARYLVEGAKHLRHKDFDWGIEDVTVGQILSGLRLRWVTYPYKVMRDSRTMKIASCGADHEGNEEPYEQMVLENKKIEEEQIITSNNSVEDSLQSYNNDADGQEMTCDDADGHQKCATTMQNM